MVKNMYDIIDYAITTKRFVGGLGKIAKDGSIRKINGQVFKRYTTKNGKEVVLIDNFLGQLRKGQKKRWQMVLLDNLISLNENHWSHTRRG